MLGTLDDLTVNLKKIRSLKGFEAKIIIAVVAVIDDGRIKLLAMGTNDPVELVGDQRSMKASVRVDIVIKLLHDTSKLLLGLLVKVGDGNPSSQKRIIGMLSCHTGGCFGRQGV